MHCAKENQTNIMFLTSTFLALVQVVAVYIQTRMMFQMKAWKSKSLMQMRCWTSTRYWFSTSYVPTFLRTSPTSVAPLAPSGSFYIKTKNPNVSAKIFFFSPVVIQPPSHVVHKPMECAVKALRNVICIQGWVYTKGGPQINETPRDLIG